MRPKHSVDEQDSHEHHDDPDDLNDFWRKGDPDNAIENPKNKPHDKREDRQIDQKGDDGLNHFTKPWP